MRISLPHDATSANNVQVLHHRAKAPDKTVLSKLFSVVWLLWTCYVIWIYLIRLQLRSCANVKVRCNISLYLKPFLVQIDTYAMWRVLSKSQEDTIYLNWLIFLLEIGVLFFFLSLRNWNTRLKNKLFFIKTGIKYEDSIFI